MPNRRWGLFTGLLIFFITTLVAAHWPILPWFLDYFYHLAVLEGFRQSGGLVLHDWWEFSPLGRPHLYPPLGHLIWLPFLLVGIPAIALARLGCVISFPLVAITLWWTLRRSFDPRTVALCILFLTIPVGLTNAILNYPPSTLSVVLGLVAWMGVERKRILASSIALGLIGWTHTGQFLLFLCAFLLYGILRKETRAPALLSCLNGLMLASPWLFHQWLHREIIHLVPRREQEYVELAPLVFLLAGWALLKVKEFPPPFRFLIAWALAALPLGITYRFRLLSGHGLIPWVLLAGFGAALLWKRDVKWRAGLLVALCLWPVWHRDLIGTRWELAENSPFTLAGWREDRERVTSQPIYFKKFWQPVAEWIEKDLQPDELFFCNVEYASGLLTVLSRRATTVGMLGEVRSPSMDPVLPAKLIVWIRVPDRNAAQTLEKLIRDYELKFLGETEIALFYQNPNGNGRRQIRRAFFPWWVTTLLIGLIAWGLVRDLKKS